MTERTAILPNSTEDWPRWSKLPGDNLPFRLDCGAWLNTNEFVLESVEVEASAALTVGVPVLSGVSNAPTVITVQISGGTPITLETVKFILHLDVGTKEAVVFLWVEADLANLVPVGPVDLIGFADDALNELVSDAGDLLVAD